MLMGLKSKLFEANLAVHTLLADVSDNSEDEVKYLEVDHMKDDVVELYDIWDECLTFVTAKVRKAEESVKNISKIEKDLTELSDFLNKETKALYDKITTMDDSGMSDGNSEMFTSIDIPEKERNLKNLKICVLEISKTLSPKSPIILSISSALNESATQLKSLKIYLQHKKPIPVKPVNPNPLKKDESDNFFQRVKKFSKLFIFLLFILLLLLVLITPTCCEFKNNMFLFYPRLSYVNGPPPT